MALTSALWSSGDLCSSLFPPPAAGAYPLATVDYCFANLLPWAELQKGSETRREDARIPKVLSNLMRQCFNTGPLGAFLHT